MVQGIKMAEIFMPLKLMLARIKKMLEVSIWTYDIHAE
jgi:hypothetical protein